MRQCTYMMFQIYFTTQPIDFWNFSFSVVIKQVSKRLSIDTLSLRLVYTCYSFFNCCKRFDKTLQVHVYNRTQYVDVNIIKQILIPGFVLKIAFLWNLEFADYKTIDVHICRICFPVDTLQLMILT